MSIKLLLSTLMLVCIALAGNGYNANRRDYGRRPGNITQFTLGRGSFIDDQGRGKGNGDRSGNPKIRWCRKANSNASQFPELAGAKSVYYPGVASNNYANKGVYIFGGYKESITPDVPHIYSNEVYRYNINSGAFSLVTTTGSKPAPKAFHIVSLRSNTNSMVVALGGTFASDGSNFESFPEIHSLNLETKVWSQSIPNNWPLEFNAFDFGTFSYTNFPVGMVASNGFVTGNSLFVFGGVRIGDFSFQNDFNVYWVYDFASRNWETVDGTDVANFPVPGYDRSCTYDNVNNRFHCYGGEHIDFFPPDFFPVYSIPNPIQFVFNPFTRSFDSFAGATYTDGTDTLTPRNTGNNMATLRINSESSSSSVTLLYGGDIGGIPAGQNCPANSFLQNNVDDAWAFVSRNNGVKKWRFLDQRVADDCPNALPLNYKRGDSVTFYDENEGRHLTLLYGGWSYSLTCVQSFNRNAWVGRVNGSL